jgi:hypothetical protein
MAMMQLILSKKRQGKSIFISSCFSHTQTHTTLKIVHTILSYTRITSSAQLYSHLFSLDSSLLILLTTNEIK